MVACGERDVARQRNDDRSRHAACHARAWGRGEGRTFAERAATLEEGAFHARGKAAGNATFAERKATIDFHDDWVFLGTCRTALFRFEQAALMLTSSQAEAPACDQSVAPNFRRTRCRNLSPTRAGRSSNPRPWPLPWLPSPQPALAEDVHELKRTVEPSKQPGPNDKIQIATIGMGIIGFIDTTCALKVPGIELVAAADLYEGPAHPRQGSLRR